MDKEQFQKAMMLYNTGAISLPEFTEFCMTYIKELEQRVEVLTYMDEPKTCDKCIKYGANCKKDYDKNYCTKLGMFTGDKFGCIFFSNEDT